MRIVSLAIVVLTLALPVAQGAEPTLLSEDTLHASADQYGVVLLAINWGRQWGCADLDNAQLQSLTFLRRPDGTTLEFKTPSRLFVDDQYSQFVVIVEPGHWDLAGFDVKIARSSNQIGHLLSEPGTTYGSFEIAAGEFVYIGHFSLDCAQEPIPWRYYVETGDFEHYVTGFRRQYPYVGDADVDYRLFETDTLGH